MRVYCDSPIDAEWVCGCKGWRSRKGVGVEAPRQRLLPICRGVPCQDASAILFCVCVVLACVVVCCLLFVVCCLLLSLSSLLLWLFFLFFFVVLVVVVVVVVGWKGCGCKRRQPKKNKLEGGWGGGRSASPPDALDVFTSLGRETKQQP